MSEGMLASIAAVAAVLVALAQWFFTSRAASRQRDVEMTQWGQEVIDVMAEIETACFPLSPETTYSAAETEKLSQRASALVDKGRLFFPNVKEQGGGRLLDLQFTWWSTPSAKAKGGKNDDEGTRVKVLDHVLRVCYVARHVSVGKEGDRKTLRQHVWQSRRDFVELLQDEVGGSMRRKIRPVGDHVLKDPTRWELPERPLTLPWPVASNARRKRHNRPLESERA
ncbi:hypothetical protein [Ensifer adhaerens]|uniref:hypothetical protein n=1 Tax=Ensifer adhaerens TaxID=106592 RepID=UPI000CF01888|nr:hypothetical protein [Ensifer adhaerens]